MAAAEVVEAPAVDKPPATEEFKPAEKVVKEKKPKAPKEKKPKQPKAGPHPPYFQMIKEALLTLNEKSGSSPYAIAKFMEDKHKAVLPANFKKILGLQLKNSANRGKLIKIRASYKLSESGKKDKGKAKVAKDGTEKKPKDTGARRKRKTKSVYTTEAPKNAKNKDAAKKVKQSAPVKPKQPKSIRRARRASAS